MADQHNRANRRQNHDRPLELTTTAETWVVYQTTVKGMPTGPNVICRKREWEALELANPGQNVLILSGIMSEIEAERIARGTSGDSKPRDPPMPPIELTNE